MTHSEILFFRAVELLSVLGALAILGFEIKASVHWFGRLREWRNIGGRRPRRSMQASFARFSTVNILFAAASVCDLVTGNRPLFHGLMALFFLGVAEIVIHVPRVGRNLGMRLTQPDPASHAAHSR